MQSAMYPSIMVAESSTDIRELLRYWLEMKRCRVVEAIDGHEAVAITLADRPDLILMGFNMQVFDGLATARRIREGAGNCDVPIVCMSTYPTQEAQATALAAGCSWFISQPIDFDQLSLLLETLLPAQVSH